MRVGHSWSTGTVYLLLVSLILSTIQLMIQKEGKLIVDRA